MPRNPEYQVFLNNVEGTTEDTLPKDEEFPATQQEIGWWKQHQIQVAIHAARYGRATPVQLSLLESHNIPAAAPARKRNKRSGR